MGWTSSSRIAAGSALLVLALLLFLNLGDRVITGDEAYTIIQAKTVVEHGYPYPFYRNVEILPKATYYLGAIPLFNWTPWLESYLAALMLLLAGMNEFWLRFPFTLFGIATILLSYFFTKKITKEDRVTTILTTILLATSITFLLHMREARWYSLASFFALATWYTYWLWLKENRSPALFIASAALLFHSQVFIFFAVMCSLAVYHIIFERTSKSVKQLAAPLLAIGVLTLPWFILTGQLAGKAGGITLNPLKIGINLALYAYYSSVLLISVIFIIFLIVIKVKEKIPMSEEAKYLATIILASFAFLTIKGDLLPAVRYLVFLIPLFCLVNAYIIRQMKNKSKMIAIICILLLVTTNAIQIAPFVPLKPILSTIALGRSAAETQGFLANSLEFRPYLLNYIYEITHDYSGTDDEIVKLLKEKSTPQDTFTTSDFTHTLLIYTDMNASLPDLRVEAYNKRMGIKEERRKPAWIIPRGFTLQQKNIEEYKKEVDRLYNLSTYEPITLSINDDEQWASAPDSINHKFKTDRSGTLTIYHKTTTA